MPSIAGHQDVLKKKEGEEWVKFYVVADEKTMKFIWYHSQKDAANNAKPHGCVPFLAIKEVAQINNQRFNVTLHSGGKHKFAVKVASDVVVWVDRLNALREQAIRSPPPPSANTAGGTPDRASQLARSSATSTRSAGSNEPTPNTPSKGKFFPRSSTSQSSTSSLSSPSMSSAALLSPPGNHRTLDPSVAPSDFDSLATFHAGDMYEGCLYKKARLKGWVPKYFVLDGQESALKYYPSEKDRAQTPDKMRFIPFKAIVSANQGKQDNSGKFELITLDFNRKEKTISLRAENEEEAHRWIDRLLDARTIGVRCKVKVNSPLDQSRTKLQSHYSHLHHCASRRVIRLRLRYITVTYTIVLASCHKATTALHHSHLHHCASVEVENLASYFCADHCALPTTVPLTIVLMYMLCVEVENLVRATHDVGKGGKPGQSNELRHSHSGAPSHYTIVLYRVIKATTGASCANTIVKVENLARATNYVTVTPAHPHTTLLCCFVS
eukprot:g18261.t1